ncbi:hypothetical protein HAP94_11410 [Acidithiobacillus ferrivorans]|nr:hypothetical protein [Acidithiobacillus ferrivorans]
MTSTEVVTLLRSAIGHAILGFLPIGIAALVVGLGVTLLQAWLHWNDVSLSFVPKVIVVGLLVLLAWWGFVSGFTHWWQSLARMVYIR